MKILKYQIMTEVNLGTKEHPNIVQVFDDKDMRCSDANFETSYAMALKEAYNGEVTIEDDGKPEPVNPTLADHEVLNALLGVIE